MTSPYVSFPPAPGARPSAWPVLRAMLATVVVLLGVVGFAIAGLIALLTWSGCFIECTGTNHRGGFLLALLAVISLASGPAAVSGLYRSARWMWGAAWAAGIGALLMTLVLAAN
jgi:hypothetical protein